MTELFVLLGLAVILWLIFAFGLFTGRLAPALWRKTRALSAPLTEPHDGRRDRFQSADCDDQGDTSSASGGYEDRREAGGPRRSVGSL